MVGFESGVVMNSILIMFHLESSAGYAMDNLLPTFVQMAEILVGQRKKIHVSFTRLDGGAHKKLLDGFDQLIEFDPASKSKSQHTFIENYVRQHRIDVVFGFDQLVWQPSYKYLRKGGVSKIVSYQGAPMSGLNRGIKLALKKLEVWLTPGSPDHFIFESQAMAKTAYQGRGIPKDKVSIVYLGVDEVKFKPTSDEYKYAHDTFEIPADRKIIYYSGHMEERKGVAVLIRAAMYLYGHYGRRDFHFLILGNKDGQEQRFLKLLGESGAGNHVTFGGYRRDIEKIVPSCFMGAIASTGWDSFTVSSLEVAACGLPLVVSNLQGLIETIEEGKTGFTFQPGDYKALANHIITLLDNQEIRNSMGENARKRILAGFTRPMQIDRLVDVMQKVAG